MYQQLGHWETRGLQTVANTAGDLTSAASHSSSLCHHQVALVKKKHRRLQPPPHPSPLSPSLSFDMLLIWQVKVCFVTSTSPFILLGSFCPVVQEPYAPLPHDCFCCCCCCGCISAVYCRLITVCIKTRWDATCYRVVPHHTVCTASIELPGIREQRPCHLSLLILQKYQWACMFKFCLLYNSGRPKYALPLLPLKGGVCVYIPN